MKEVKWEWILFCILLGGFIGLEEYAVHSGKIKPFSSLVWKASEKEMMRYVLCGAWIGFNAWTTKHFFFEKRT